MDTNRISDVLDDRFLIATYMTIVERIYGKVGLRAAKELLTEVRNLGDQALDNRCDGGSGRSTGVYAVPQSTESQHSYRSDFVVACIELEIISNSELEDDGLPCPIQCASDQEDCDANCNSLPDFSTRLVCNLACGFKFLACLAKC